MRGTGRRRRRPYKRDNMGTKTGNFAIGFRRGGTEWQKSLANQAKWAKQAGFDAIDLGKATKEDVATLKDAGVRMGSADLLDFGNIMQNDPGKRRELIEANVSYVRE